MNSYLEQFEQNIVNTLKTAKYLLVVKDKMLIKPKTYLNMFEPGYVYSEVQVYDLASKKLIDTFDVGAKNSHEVYESMFSSDDAIHKTLMRNLYDNLYGNAIIKAKQKL